jgi:hypothetical protein
MLGWPFLAAYLLHLRERWPAAESNWLDWLILLFATTFAYSAFASLRSAMRHARVKGAAWPSVFLRDKSFRWGLAYGVIALAFGYRLFLAPEHRALCWLAVIGSLSLILNLAIVRGRAERSLAGELFGALTLSLAMPAALVLAFNGWHAGYSGLWTLTFLFNASGILYARMCRDAVVNGLESDTLMVKVRQLASFMLASFVILTVQLVSKKIGWMSTLTLLPTWLMMRAGIQNPLIHTSIKALGFTLLGQAILLALLMGFAY